MDRVMEMKKWAGKVIAKVFLIPMYRASGINKSPKIPDSFKKEKECTPG